MGQVRKDARGAAAEAVSARINEAPPPARQLPFRLTYLGEGVVEVPGVGRFARHTTASVDAATAARHEGDPAWAVERRPGSR